MVTVTMKSGYLEEIMTDEVREYAERKIWEIGVRRVPGHYPHFKTKQDVDRFADLEWIMFWDAFVEDEIPEINSIDIQRYKDLLWKLKKNEDNVPLEILRTKHRTAYNSLRQELKKMTEAVIHEVVHRNLYIKRSDEEKSLQRIDQAVADSGLCESISQAVYQKKCYGSVIVSVMELRKLVMDAAEEETV